VRRGGGGGGGGGPSAARPRFIPFRLPRNASTYWPCLPVGARPFATLAIAPTGCRQTMRCVYRNQNDRFTHTDCGFRGPSRPGGRNDFFHPATHTSPGNRRHNTVTDCPLAGLPVPCGFGFIQISRGHPALRSDMACTPHRRPTQVDEPHRSSNSNTIFASAFGDYAHADHVLHRTSRTRARTGRTG